MDSQTYIDVVHFLFHEAELLDQRRFDEWLECLADDIEYTVPVRQSVSSSDSDDPVDMSTGAPTGKGSLLHENRRSIETRVRRLQTAGAWAEEPPSRSRHFVTNIRVSCDEDTNEVDARSYVWLYRSHGRDMEDETLSGERHDRLRRVNGTWKIARRQVILDHTAIKARDLAIFL